MPCAALFNGATLVTLPAFNPRTALSCLAEERISIFPTVPFMIKLIVMTRLREEADLSRLRLCFTAGAPLEEETGEAFRQRFACSVCQLYGSTETGAIALDYSDELEVDLKSVGRPLKHVQVDILDEAGQLLGVGETGEIAIRTVAATSAYDKNPEATENSFRAGYFLPGDLGHRDADGRIHITGRKSSSSMRAATRSTPRKSKTVSNRCPKWKKWSALAYAPSTVAS